MTFKKHIQWAGANVAGALLAVEAFGYFLAQGQILGSAMTAILAISHSWTAAAHIADAFEKNSPS